MFKRTPKPVQQNGAPKINKFEKMLLGKETDYLIEYLSLLLDSGMNIVNAFSSIKRGIKSNKLKKIIDYLLSQVGQGVPLSKALSATNLFSGYTIALIKIGEESGRLPDNLKVINEKNAKDRLFRSKLRSAMAYPAIVLVVTLGVGSGITYFILPKLKAMFEGMNVDLPLLTRVLITIGEYMQRYGYILIPLSIILIGGALYFLFLHDKTKHIGENILLKIPGVGRLIKEIELARFGFIMGTLLNAGLPILQAINSLQNSTPIKKYRDFYSFLQERVQSGSSFYQAFASYKQLDKLIPSFIQQLVFSAEESGNLVRVYLKIAENYEEKVDITTKNLSVMLEPILLVIVWAGVLIIALAVMLPIYQLIGNLDSL